jgi:hypothetical protein
MFDSDDEQVNTNVSQRNGWMQALGVFLGIFLACAFYAMTNFYYAKRDAEIAPRQQSAMGIITAKIGGKQSSIYYRFPCPDRYYPYLVRYYDDSESGGSGFNVGQQVRVYFDPIHPWAGSLSDFYVSSERHRMKWKFSLASSIISGLFAGFCGSRALERKREINVSATDQEN